MPDSEIKDDGLVEEYVENTLSMTYDQFLTQLPTHNNDKSYAFGEEIVGFLQDRGMGRLVPIFKGKNLSLFKFLTLTEDDLREVGVRFSRDRRQILEMLKRFHLLQWNTLATLNLKSSKMVFNVGDGLVVLSRITQQLYVEYATVAYLRMRLSETLEQMDSAERKAYLTTLAGRCRDAQALAKTMCKQMRSVHTQTKKKAYGVSPVPADYIGNTGSSKWPRKFVKTLFVTSIIGLTLWRMKLLMPSSFRVLRIGVCH